MDSTYKRPKTVHFGLRPKQDKPSLKFKSFVRAPAGPVGALPPVVEPRFAETADYLEPFIGWDPLGNDVFNNCNAVAWANQRRVVSATLGPREVWPSFDEVIAFYKSQNPEFDPRGDPEINGAQSPADGGMFLQQSLEYLLANGGPDGVKPIAFAEIDSTDLEAVHQAINIFGSLWIGLRIYPTTVDQWNSGQPWASPEPGTALTSRHAVIVGGYLPQKKFVTWGATTKFDDSYWLTRDVDEAWVVIWPEHLGTRPFMNGVDLRQLAFEMKKLTGHDLNLPVFPFADLYFIKTKNPESRVAEVHIVDHAQNYAFPPDIFPSAASLADGQDCIFNVWNGDLYLIQIRNTASGMVEVFRTTRKGEFQDGFDLAFITGIGVEEADNGVWEIDGGDLYFIKTKNTPFKMIEIYRLDHMTFISAPDVPQPVSYPTLIGESEARNGESEARNGVFTVSGGDVFFIKFRNTLFESVQIQILDGNHNYVLQEATITTTFQASPARDGVWKIGPSRDLYFIKTRNTGTGMVQVQVSRSSADYRSISHFATSITLAEAENGTFTI